MMTENNGNKRKFIDLDKSEDEVEYSTKHIKHNDNGNNVTRSVAKSAYVMYKGLYVPVKFFKLSLKQQLLVYSAVVGRLNIMLTGSAGCGKTFAMEILKDMYEKNYPEKKLQFCATSGLATTHLPRGITLHAFMGLGWAEGDPVELAKKAAGNSKIRKKVLETDLLVIDEISMAEPRLVDLLDLMCRKIRNVHDKAFGGMQVILVGDYFQIPPVVKRNQGETSNSYKTNNTKGSNSVQQVYKNSVMDTTDDTTEQIYSKYRFCFELPNFFKEMIDFSVNLTEIFRQNDPEFIALLERVRRGELTEEDHLLFENMVKQSKLKFANAAIAAGGGASANGADAVFDTTELNPNKFNVKKINDSALQKLQTNPANPQKKHQFKFKSTPSKKQGSNPILFEAWLENMKKECLAGTMVELCVGSQVMLVCNLDLETGLVNGAQGIVTGFHTVERCPIVKFNNGLIETVRVHSWKCEDEIAAENNKSYAASGPPWNKSKQRREDIPHITYEQIPLTLAHALTIHKAQGTTLEKVKLSLANCFEEGMAYVALSRCKTLQGIELTSYSRSAIKTNPKVIDFYNKVEQSFAPIELRLAALAPYEEQREQDRNQTSAAHHALFELLHDIVTQLVQEKELKMQKQYGKVTRFLQPR